MKRGYMVDTNIFDAFAKGRLSLHEFSYRPLFSTSIQRKELESTRDGALRSLLIQAFIEAKTEKLSTSTAVWDISGWDEAKWGSEDQNKFVEQFAESLQQMDKSSGKRPKDTFRNAMHDALIAVTAREYGLVLLTQDKNLHALAKENGVLADLIPNVK